MLKRTVIVLAGSLAGALPAASSVVTEESSQFSRQWNAPTLIGSGPDTILGTAETQNGHEFIALTGLAVGAQTLTFTFDAPDWALSSDSYSAGGQVLWSSDPFRHGWDGTSIGSYQLSRWTPKRVLDLALDDTFDGSLYLGIYFTHGSDVAWSLRAPGNAAASDPPAPGQESAAVVPLPGALWLMTLVLIVFGGLVARHGPGRRTT